MKKLLVMILVVTMLAGLVGCGKAATDQPAQDTPAAAESGEPIAEKPAAEHAEDLSAVVKSAVGCDQEEAEDLIRQIEDIANVRIASAEIVNVAELPAGVRRILKVYTPNDGDTFLVSISKNTEVLKVVSEKTKVVLYDADAGIDLREN